MMQDWEHDPDRDGGGCTWCGAWAKVNGDLACESCWEGAQEQERDEWAAAGPSATEIENMVRDDEAEVAGHFGG